ncbi:MAG TPA: KpsF/GutQ family sugar-phosphate isomerase, partial [Candidatus Goldiibacteriota bacterium]|nr:KpsF/GutQ family sugar-phosphate isomerase [Candidatus Goldiibacteriota bacterium]
RRAGAEYDRAAAIIRACRGKVVVIGLGKSGLIGQKISATLSSTGTPSVFLHPVEAAHGDMGIIMKNDAALLISQSGETDEVKAIMPALLRLKIPMIVITGNMRSTLAKKANVVISSWVPSEACPMGLAPTASTTAQLAIGDAIAVAVLKMKGFKKEDFARLHPGGALGKKLVLKVDDIMHSGMDIPIVAEKTKLREALLEMTNKRLGCTLVCGPKGKITGIFTDGDLRRLLEKSINPYSEIMSGIMKRKPVYILPSSLAADALAIMEDKKITVLPVIAKNGKPQGIIHLHDLIKAGLDG